MAKNKTANKAHKVKKRTTEDREAALGSKVLLFTLPGVNDGDPDREYYIHEKLPFNKVLAISRLVDNGIAEDKLMWLMLDDLVGADGVSDLLNCEDLTMEDFAAISVILGEILQNSYEVEAPKA